MRSTTARLGLLAVSAFALAACFPTTTRPPFLPEPSAPVFEVELTVADATRALALALDADSFPIRRTEVKDGWLESDWFNASTRQPTSQRRLGPGVVKLRAFIDPARAGSSDSTHSNITVEVVYRPLADPSRSDRDLEREVPANHPIEGRVVLLLTRLVKLVSGDTVTARPAVKPDSGSGVVPTAHRRERDR